MMGTKFWAGLAEKIGFKPGAPMVKVASAEKVEIVHLPDRIVLREARAAGFFKLARPMGWGLYRVEDIDGGLGSIWSIEKAADGSQFLVKQIDPEGEVLRKTAAGGPKSKKCSCGGPMEECPHCEAWACPKCSEVHFDDHDEAHRDVENPPGSSTRGASVERVAVAPPGEEKLVKKLKHDPDVDNPWAVAWSVHNKKKASTVYCSEIGCERVAHDKSGGKYFCSKHLPEKSTKTADSRDGDIWKGIMKDPNWAQNAPGSNAPNAVAKRLVEIRKELEYGNSDDARDWLHALSTETPGALGRKINLVWHAMEKDTENGIDEMITLFREIGGNEAEWDAAVEPPDEIDPHMTEHGIGPKPDDVASISDKDVVIREAAEKCPTCGKPMKENTDGNPKYCQGHD